MTRFLCTLVCMAALHPLVAQNKKPLTHDVYDGWRSVGQRTISNDGRFVMYAVNPQEGDGEVIIQNVESGYKKTIARGYNASFSEDSKYAVLSIKPAFQDIRQAKIKKKKADDIPKDSLAILLLGTDSLVKIAKIKSYKMPEKAAGWLVYHLEKAAQDSSRKKAAPDSVKTRIDMLTKLADSLIRKSLDSIKGKIEKEEVLSATRKAVKEIYKKADEWQLEENNAVDADGDEPSTAGAAGEGTELVVRNLANGATKSFKMVSEYVLDEKGTRLLVETTKNSKDTNSKAYVLMHQLATGRTDTIMRAFNDAKNYVFDEDGKQLAFVAERDSSSKALQKYSKLWYYQAGADTAVVRVAKNTIGMPIGFTVSDNALLRFSKNGKKLFFGTSPMQPPKDTTLVDFELARLDVWHYNDDYLQPQQLRQLTQEARRSYLAVAHMGSNEIVQLGADGAEEAILVNEGDADWVLAQSTKGNRSALQWEGRVKSTAFVVDTRTAQRTQIKSNSYGNYQASPGGNYVYWYDPQAQHYFTYNVATGTIKNITGNIKVPLYDTENDVPDFPRAAGTIGWMSGDAYFFIKDEFDIWQVDPAGRDASLNITNGYGRKNKIDFDYVRLDADKRFVEPGENILLRAQDKGNKDGGFFTKTIGTEGDPQKVTMGKFAPAQVTKAKNASRYLLQKQTVQSSELFYGNDMTTATQLTNLVEQQKDYNWLTAELVRWKMFDGKMSEGLLFKPENFDGKKKYPVIFYFYERNADGLHNYRTPAPSASTINIAYFVSNGYLVFDPNIYYKTGEPGPSAYNSVVSAAKHLSTMPFVDSTKMGIQGQSWGGYQVAYLVTRTNMFKAAGAGAPVANMTSAYGGIRWGAGINRQFQYEKTQSRIGATLWQRPDLYIKNSPLFTADKINTPLLIMHNDADGAVPWYQGIELFTAMKRLGKKVWMLQYNGEDHNLVERKNRKDLSVRLSQFFDYHLKGAKAASWIKEGLPAVYKGREWGLGTD